MTKEEYQEALKSPQWIIKRNRVKKRDKHKCVKCKSNKNLHIHHTYYLKDKMPWQVPDECLITLCEVCHEKEHKGKPILSFMRVKPPKTEVTPLPKIKIKKDKPEKLKKMRLYRYIALKSKTIKKVFDKTTDRRDISKLAGEVGGILKGFDNKIAAEKWLKEKDKKLTKRQRREKKFLENNK